MAEKIRAETREIAPRYYGLAFSDNGKRVIDNPTTAALAFVVITSPDKEGGLVDMLGKWQERKRKELSGEAGYEPLFQLTPRQAKKLLDCRKERLAEIVREAIRRTNGSYNLWDCYGKDAVSDLILRGEVLTARVRSQKEGWYEPVILKGAVRGRNGEIRYSGSSCLCKDNRWTEAKGGGGIDYDRNCIHIKAMETDSLLQDTRVQHPSRVLMREKRAYEGERAMTFNFIDDPFLIPLIVDVLIAKEVLGDSCYNIDRKLLTQPIAGAIMPLSLQEEIASGRATFEVLKQRMKTRKTDADLLKAQEIIDEEFDSSLRKAGYSWQGYCLELGQPAYRYENEDFAVSLSIINNPLPFYVVRDLKNSRKIPILTPDYGPQIPYAQFIDKEGRLHQLRVDDRTRKMTPCRIEPAVRICIPGGVIRSLRYDLPERVIEAYRMATRQHSRHPETDLKALRIKY